MLNQIWKSVFLVCLGAGLGWFAAGVLNDRNSSQNIAKQRASPVTLNVQTTDGIVLSSDQGDPNAATENNFAREAELTLERRRNSISVTNGNMTSYTGQNLEPRDDGSRDQGNVASRPPGDAGHERDATVIQSAPWERPAANPLELMKSAVIRCDFGPGKTGNVRSIPEDIFEWKGGSITFDSFDPDQKSAQMVGSIGATGSRTGEVVVRNDVTSTGIHFSGSLPNGNFIFVTIFGLIDERGNYSALMSRHNSAPVGLHSEVVSGTCR